MGNNRYKILVVEDEAKIYSFMEATLTANDYQVLLAETCGQGMMMFSSHLPDLVILDLGLPDMDGLEFIKAARKASSVPIIILSARTQDTDKVSALDLGANDYVTKPFSMAELLARVRAALRGRRRADADAAPRQKFVLDDLEIDYERRQVIVSGQEIGLTQTEYNILALLSEHAGKVMTYSSIVNAVWGSSDPGSVKKLQVNLANIRKKLGWKPGESRYIFNELGVGYRMRSDSEEE